MKVVVRARNERVVATLHLRVLWMPTCPPELRRLDLNLPRCDGEFAGAYAPKPITLRRKA